MLNVCAGLVVARAIGPVDYGNLVFLLGSFEAIRQGVNLGTSNAFYTFISQKDRGLRFVRAYWLWQFLQFGIVCVVVATILPDRWFDKVWLGQDRTAAIFACCAVCFQGQIWQTVVQIGESRRQTLIVQFLSLGVAIAHIIAVTVAALLGALNLKILFVMMMVEYVIAIAASSYLIPAVKDTSVTAPGNASHDRWLRAFVLYCAPLVLYNLVSFLYEFSDKWLLQHYGGSVQQGLYGVSAQFSAACLLATTSMVRIFWKETAELHQNGDFQRLRELFQTTCRGLFAFGAVLGGMLCPWTDRIVSAIVGPGFHDAWLPLAIMFLYPVHQSLGQVTQTFFLSTGNTVAYVWSGLIFMLVSIPVTFAMLAPST
jgi:O-antigen/teichoic acid export membrane protein